MTEEIWNDIDEYPKQSRQSKKQKVAIYYHNTEKFVNFITKKINLHILNELS